MQQEPSSAGAHIPPDYACSVMLRWAKHNS
jgi:hypothetical protein